MPSVTMLYRILPTNTPMKAEYNKKVAVSYELTVDGKVEDRADENNPLEFIPGHGQLLAGFEDAILGLEPGQTFELTLTPEQGYGEWDEQYKAELPKSIFLIDGELAKDILVPGNTVPLTTKGGQTMVGKVVEVNDETVTMDFNHPMAGKTLHFTGKVIEVREPTFEEIQELLSRKSRGCDCGCDCGSDGEMGCSGCC